MNQQTVTQMEIELQNGMKALLGIQSQVVKLEVEKTQLKNMLTKFIEEASFDPRAEYEQSNETLIKDARILLNIV